MKKYTKTELTKLCRYILYHTNRFVNKRSEHILVSLVLCNHPEWERKRGCGIDHLEVRNDNYGGKCFWIIRLDGTETDISFTTSIRYSNGVDYKYKLDTISRACRNAILPEILNLRNNIKLPFICPITGETIYDKHFIHIDHYDMCFQDLFNLWMKGKDINKLYMCTRSSSTDGDTKTWFDDKDINDDFIKFHNLHTHLRVVSKIANLSILRK